MPPPPAQWEQVDVRGLRMERTRDFGESYSPLTEENPVANLGIGALLDQSIGAIVSPCLGGWIAGRFSPADARATGWLHLG